MKLKKRNLILTGFGILILFLTGTILFNHQSRYIEEERVINFERYENATFAGGCFWCVEVDFEKLPGVVEAISGYSGGDVENPIYEEVSLGKTGHLESVLVIYDPNFISYDELVYSFFRHVDPTDPGGQFVDRGKQYSTSIFYNTPEQKETAEKIKKELNDSGIFGKEIVTEIRKFENFYNAEEYHQDFYKKSEIKYKFYRYNSGRDQFIEEYWINVSFGLKETKEGLKTRLTDLQYRVTQLDETEPPFNNQYWDNKEPGIYVDIVSGEPLFSSIDKYDSGTGWPSFTKPLEQTNIVLVEDNSLFIKRVEVRSKKGDSHLGHVFDDGPAPTGKRYCMNSAALKFIPKEDLEKEGYGRYLELFE